MWGWYGAPYLSQPLPQQQLAALLLVLLLVLT
jgi:hypothetical protein